MVTWNATIRKFDSKGEKTGWTYVEVPAAKAEKLKPGHRLSFRVRGTLDGHPVSAVAVIPMGGGSFIIALNADMRKAIRKRAGAMVKVSLEEDTKGYVMNADFLECLADDPSALTFFKTLPGAHQRYFSRWIDSAKTEPTRVKRITMAVTALGKKQGYQEMMRASKAGR